VSPSFPPSSGREWSQFLPLHRFLIQQLHQRLSNDRHCVSSPNEFIPPSPPLYSYSLSHNSSPKTSSPSPIVSNPPLIPPRLLHTLSLFSHLFFPLLTSINISPSLTGHLHITLFPTPESSERETYALKVRTTGKQVIGSSSVSLSIHSN
jgi:hypothetical protein